MQRLTSRARRPAGRRARRLRGARRRCCWCRCSASPPSPSTSARSTPSAPGSRSPPTPPPSPSPPTAPAAPAATCRPPRRAWSRPTSAGPPSAPPVLSSNPPSVTVTGSTPDRALVRAGHRPRLHHRLGHGDRRLGRARRRDGGAAADLLVVRVVRPDRRRHAVDDRRAHDHAAQDVGHRLHRPVGHVRARRLRLAGHDRRQHLQGDQPGRRLVRLGDRATTRRRAADRRPRRAASAAPSCCRSSTGPAGTGSDAWYHVYGYAAFTITGYYFAGQYKWHKPCNGNDRCIRGYFTQFVEPSDAFFYDSTAPVSGCVDPPTGPIGAPIHATSTARRARGARPARSPAPSCSWPTSAAPTPVPWPACAPSRCWSPTSSSPRAPPPTELAALVRTEVLPAKAALDGRVTDLADARRSGGHRRPAARRAAAHRPLRRPERAGRAGHRAGARRPAGGQRAARAAARGRRPARGRRHRRRRRLADLRGRDGGHARGPAPRPGHPGAGRAGGGPTGEAGGPADRVVRPGARRAACWSPSPSTAGDAETVVFGVEHGTLWLSLEPEGADTDGTDDHPPGQRLRKDVA